jgi:hypothetical protein
LEKVGQLWKKSDGNSQCPDRFFDFRPTFQKDRQLLRFPDNFMEIRPEISKVGLLFAKSSNFCRIRVTPQHSIGVLERSLGNLRRRPSAFFADAPIGCRSGVICLPSHLLEENGNTRHILNFFAKLKKVRVEDFSPILMTSS